MLLERGEKIPAETSCQRYITKMPYWVVVGISGVTNGGKSTLTQRLQAALPPNTQVISQDDYFFSEDSSKHVPCPGNIKHHNWDIISAIDMKAMMHDVKGVLESYPKPDPQASQLGSKGVSVSSRSSSEEPSPVLLLDGFVLYDDPGIVKLCDLRYFFTLSHEQCWERRQVRSYDPPDPPGYFQECVWPMYEEHLVRVKESVPEVVFLDGMKDPFPVVLKQIVAACQYRGK